MLQRTDKPIDMHQPDEALGAQMLAWAGEARRRALRALSAKEKLWEKALCRQRLVRAREYDKPRLP